MEAPSPRYILSRAVFLIVSVVVVLSCVSFYKKKQRQAAVIADLKSLSSDSSFFQQFYAEDAQKALIRAVALIAEANALGIPPESAIDRAIGIETKNFFAEEKPAEPTTREELIRTSLRANYENFLKLGYNADFPTLETMKAGSLPPIPSGPEAGKKPVVGTSSAPRHPRESRRSWPTSKSVRPNRTTASRPTSKSPPPSCLPTLWRKQNSSKSRSATRSSKACPKGRLDRPVA